MTHLNVEIKAHCADLSQIRDILTSKHAMFKGTAHQIDTYFKCRMGRLKLREDQFESTLIHYVREEIAGPKKSQVTLYTTNAPATLKESLKKSLGILTIVDKKREIYWIDNVKFHLDTVDKLGEFVEIEAIDYDGTLGAEKLYQQCNLYLELFGIQTSQLIRDSYSDLLMAQTGLKGD